MKYYILSLCLISIFGCTPKEQSSNSDLSANEIAHALQMKVWKVKVPEDLPEGKQLALKLSFDGKVSTIAWLAPDRGFVHKLIIWPTEDGKQLNLFNQLKSGATTVGTFQPKIFRGHKSYENLNKICGVGDTLFWNDVEEHYKVYVGVIDEL